MPKPKPTEKMLQTGYRVSGVKKKELEEVAKLRGTSIQAIVDEAVDLRLGVTEGFWDQIVSLAEKLNIPAADVIVNMIIKKLAFEYAWVRVFENAPPGLFREFRFDQEGFVTGERLSETLVDEYIKKLEKLKAKSTRVKGEIETSQKIDRRDEHYYFSNEEISMMIGGQL